jgi:hypothetical protein
MGEIIEKCDLEPFPFIKIRMVYRKVLNEIHEPLKEREDQRPAPVDLRGPPGSFEDSERSAGHCTSMVGDSNLIIGKNFKNAPGDMPQEYLDVRDGSLVRTLERAIGLSPGFLSHSLKMQMNEPGPLLW